MSVAAMQPAMAEVSNDIHDYDLLVTSAAAANTVRDGVYRFDAATGRLAGKLVRVFDAGAGPSGQRVSRLPRGITVGPDGALYSSGADNVVRFDLQTGRFDRLVVDSPGILARSIIFIPKLSASCSQTTGSAAAQRN